MVYFDNYFFRFINVRNTKCNVDYILFQMFGGCIESCRDSQATIEVRRGILDNPIKDGHNTEQPKTQEALEMQKMI